MDTSAASASGGTSHARRRAVLAGTDRQPEVRLFFDRGERHAASGVDLIEWVKRAPRRRWDPANGCWVITSFGGVGEGGKGATAKDPDRVLAKAGFVVVVDHPERHQSLRDVISLNDLVAPLCRQSKERPGVALVRPRFAGWHVAREILGQAASWDKEAQRFEVPLTEVLRHGEVKAGLCVDDETAVAARAALLKKPTFGSDKHDDETLAADAAALALSTGLDLTDADQEQVARLTETVGDIPDWFGMDAFPFQRLGAIAACAGRNFLCDPPGLGKTAQAIAAMAIRDVDRAVVIAPPVVLTHWEREITRTGLAVAAPKPSRARKKSAQPETAQSGMAQPETARAAGAGEAPAAEPDAGSPAGRALAPPRPPGRDDASIVDPEAKNGFQTHQSAARPPRHVVVFKAGRKEPALPDRGIVVIADSLIVSRPQLRDEIGAWGPDALVYDEAHRAKNWRSARSEAVRDLCDRLRPDALRLPATGTPLFSNPAELASLLAISGHLDPVFGGFTDFMETYCKRDHFNAWVPRMTALPQLQKILAERVWVRRKKDEVMSDLPTVMRTASVIDVDLNGFRAAHNEVMDKISLWVEAFHEAEDCYPDDDTIASYAKTQIGLMSPLRRAAGVAKVPHVLDRVTEWIAGEVDLNADGSATCDRPLLIWVHHQEVIDALVDHVRSHMKAKSQGLIGVIDGGTSQNQTRDHVDAFQEGRLPVLVCSITAAGVGITLTRGCDQMFVEADWSPPVVSQAIDRQNRFGQTRPVSVNFLVAEGTLDARLHEILQRKSEIINAVTGDDSANVSPVDLERLETDTAPWKIIAGLAEIAVEQHRKQNKQHAAA